MTPESKNLAQKIRGVFSKAFLVAALVSVVVMGGTFFHLAVAGALDGDWVKAVVGLWFTLAMMAVGMEAWK